MQNNNDSILRIDKNEQETHLPTFRQTINIMGNTITNENRLEVETASTAAHRLQVRNH